MKSLKADLRPGFSVYRNGPGPVWVAPHCGPTIETATSRDDWSDAVASKCWSKTGGTLIISGIPRRQSFGIDYNREMPSEPKALSIWKEIMKDSNSDSVQKFCATYAWSAQDRREHEWKRKAYSDFWETVRRSGDVVAFIHSQFTMAKNFPSVLDVITYEGKGADKRIVGAIVDDLNARYEPFLTGVAKEYAETMLLEHRREMARIKELFSGLSLKTMRGEYRTFMLRNIKALEKYAGKDVTSALEERFSEENFLSMVKFMLSQNVCPKITVENVFRGQKAIKTKQPLFSRDRTVMEFEVSNFLGCWYPEKARDIILEIVGEVSMAGRPKKGKK